MLIDIRRIYHYREMLKNMVRKELRSRYKGSVIGFFWTFLNPLLMLIVYSIVFSTVMRVSVPGYNYSLFLFIGLIPWTYFATTIQQSTTVVFANSNLIKKIYFPRIILPLYITITNLINMILTFVIIFLAVILFKLPITILYLYLPVILLLQTIFVLGLSMILSCLTVYFRDLEHIMSIVVMAWFYLSPVVYTTEYIPQKLYNLFKLNPMLIFIDTYRDILMFNRIPDLIAILYVTLLSILILMIGYYLYSFLQKRFAEEI